MCGIAGYFGSRRLEPSTIDACLGLMGRRGPDSTGVFEHHPSADRAVYLLHSRLSIIDLEERANQPFRAGENVLVHNGELYNYLEVKRELEADGRAFGTESDTEVLLAVMKEYGWRGLDRCEGMWAFALYDEANGSLILCRDRFGEKPLYLYRDPTGLYFGSEVKFITALLGRRMEVNIDHLYRYMVNGYKALYKDGHRFFKGVSELSPASVLSIDRFGAEQSHLYWQPEFSPDDAMTYDEAVAGVRERLIRAVEIRLRADVPLAFCMSGGIDSNSLISIAKRVFDYDVHGFTIAVPDERYDEQDMVDCAVSELGIRHSSISVETNGFLPKLRTLVRQHDAPVYTINYFAHWQLMESVSAHGYRIALSGTAADELFTGYYDHHLAYLYEVRGDVALHAASLSAWEEHVKPLVRNPYLRNPELFTEDPGFRDHIFLDADDFARRLTNGWFEHFSERHFTDSLLRNRMLNEMFHENVPMFLHEDDLNAMYYSIENRSPYLDRELFEFCYRVPSKHSGPKRTREVSPARRDAGNSPSADTRQPSQSGL